MDMPWSALKTKLEAVLRGSSNADLLADVDEYVEKQGLQMHRLEEHLKASEAEINSLKTATSTMERLVQERVKGDDPINGKLPFQSGSAPSKHSVEELVDQLARVKQENDELLKQKTTSEKFYNSEIEKLCRFKENIVAHNEALSMQAKVESLNVRQERDDLLFQNADDELNKAKLQTRLDDAVQQLRELAELTEEQAKVIEWLKIHRPDEETDDRPVLLDNSRSSSSDSQADDFPTRLDVPASLASLCHEVNMAIKSPSGVAEGSKDAQESEKVEQVDSPKAAQTPEQSKPAPRPLDTPNTNAPPCELEKRAQNPRTKGRKYVPDTQGPSEDRGIEPTSPTQLANRRNQEAA